MQNVQSLWQRFQWRDIQLQLNLDDEGIAAAYQRYLEGNSTIIKIYPTLETFALEVKLAEITLNSLIDDLMFSDFHIGNGLIGSALLTLCMVSFPNDKEKYLRGQKLITNIQRDIIFNTAKFSGKTLREVIQSYIGKEG